MLDHGPASVTGSSAGSGQEHACRLAAENHGGFGVALLLSVPSRRSPAWIGVGTGILPTDGLRVESCRVEQLSERLWMLD